MKKIGECKMCIAKMEENIMVVSDEHSKNYYRSQKEESEERMKAYQDELDEINGVLKTAVEEVQKEMSTVEDVAPVVVKKSRKPVLTDKPNAKRKKGGKK